MATPKQLTLHSSAYCLDGGTVLLTGTDEDGRAHAVMLVQNRFPGGNTCGIPGRLYFDDELIPLRSDLESEVLALLRAADVRCIPEASEQAGERVQLSPNALILGDDIKQVLSRGPEDNIRGLRDQVIATVESPAYLSFAAEVDRASGG
ncbi:MAG TPA: hypothetical protein VKD72_27610 [Gemmataceae bacterium]|nr:hypothetical protein [Gemmataceae bacterium]